MAFKDSGVEAARDELRNLVKCPIDWSFITCEDLRYKMLEIWKAVAQEIALKKRSGDPTLIARYHEIGLIGPKGRHPDEQGLLDSALSRDSTYFDPENGGIDYLVEIGEIIQIRDRIQTWIEEAGGNYKKRMARFEVMRYATKEAYDKHFPSPTLSAAQIMEKSKRGKEEGSLFFQGITREILQDHMWWVFTDAWERIKNGTGRIRIYSDACCIIGAAHGQKTRIICWEVNFTAGHTHAFPEIRSSVPNGDDIFTYNDDLQGFAIME